MSVASPAGRIASKRDPELESQILQWAEDVIGEELPKGPYEEILRDGIILCKLMNAISPGSIPKFHTSGTHFKKMENLTKFTEACKRFGVDEMDVFQSVDLWERRNIPQVSQCILALGRACYLHPEYTGPCLGPKPAEKQVRQFTEEQLRAGQGVINLQYGTNRGANQSGQNFGLTRHM
ncbi:muscle-specific protein 20-like isoform X2 [Varroa jacobsoni]|uniref:muscle-specific protein 20-like isoform X2 n=1 Tax=Varroa jacobsoni TaxID=62625 RepID=UPI000BF63565|nr:muscle-specific protein 20-like isoform X2 [Varroa jacobsoni]